MIIDIHAHTFPEAIADKTIANMEKEILKQPADILHLSDSL